MELEQARALLPDTVIEIAELIGYPATERLLKALGGTTLPIGKGLKAVGSVRAQLLNDAVGEENAKRLIHHFDKSFIYLPRCDRALRHLRNRAFLDEYAALYAGGKSSLLVMTMLCPKYGFSDRYGWELLQNARRAEHEQSSLF
ncbi:hypothetical protein EHW64_13690 [Erwinia psidii]|uniref:Mor transcription activator family protein n=1 Tax=Erwinia psidii TaxID=69224 RepID=UPI00226B43B4|nr:Mor transcription activator family protein [Erwinia psidii]MCX8962155.1 hypothetical protein [Erwinia psidii]